MMMMIIIITPIPLLLMQQNSDSTGIQLKTSGIFHASNQKLCEQIAAAQRQFVCSTLCLQQANL